MDRVSFPKIGIEIPVSENAFSLFGIEVKWYAIIITAGICLAWYYVQRNARGVGLHPESVFDVLFGGVIGGIIGARLYYVLFEWSYYSQNPSQILNIRNGGLAFYGGLIGGLLVGIILAKRKKVYVLPLLDLVGPAFLIGQGIGRWGNFMNQEAFGSNTTLPWGMTSPKIEATLQNMKISMGSASESINPSQPVHPCFLYESIWCLIGFFVLYFYAKKKRKFDGEIFLLYLAWNGFGRFFIEGLRMDSLYIGPLRVSQLLAALMCIGALVIRGIILLKLKKSEKPYVLYKDTEKSKEEIDRVDTVILERKEKKETQKEIKEDDSSKEKEVIKSEEAEENKSEETKTD